MRYANWRPNHQAGWTYQILGRYHRCSTNLVQTRSRNMQENILSYRCPQTCATLYSEIPKETAIQIYNALIVPNIDYCSPVWDCLSGYLSDKLQKLQNRAARLITKLPFDTNSNHLLTTLNWERLSIRRKKRKALMMYKTMNGHAPDYLQRLFTQYYSNYNLRNSEGKLALPKTEN